MSAATGDMEHVKLHTASAIARDGLILKVQVGSRVSGINPDSGDIDQIGITLEPPETITGLGRFEQFVYRDADKRPAQTPGQNNRSADGELDLTVYGARKFCTLAGRGNPTLLEVLYVPGDAIEDISFAGSELIQNRHRFVSRAAGARYHGYLTSQLKGLESDRGTHHTNRPELIDIHGYDTKFASHAYRLGVQGIEVMQTGQISLPMTEPTRQYARAIRQGRIPKDEAVRTIHTLRNTLERAIMETKLPATADWSWIDQWLHRSHIDFWSRT